MNIVLINPPQRTGYPQPPMGLALLAAILEREGHKVSIADFSLPERALMIKDLDPDVIGLTSTTPAIAIALKIVRNAKEEFPKTRIIMGGPHPSLLPGETLANAPVDCVVVGEGDGIIGAALEANGIIHGHPVHDMDSLPYPSYHLLDWTKYKYMAPHGRYHPTMPMITSRGCPYSCQFCSKPVFGNTYRAQSPRRVLMELRDVVHAYGVKEIAFYDDVFTLDRKRTEEICEGILREGLRIHWTCETRVNLVTLELLQLMKQAGCMAIAYGIESGSPRIRQALNKGITGAQIETAVSWTHKAGIEAIGYFMTGALGETAQELRESIEFAQDLGLDYVQASQTIPYPGTALYNSLEVKPTDWGALTYTGNGHRKASDEFYHSFYFRPSYLWQRIRNIKTASDLALNLKGVGMLIKGGV